MGGSNRRQGNGESAWHQIALSHTEQGRGNRRQAARWPQYLASPVQVSGVQHDLAVWSPKLLSQLVLACRASRCRGRSCTGAQGRHEFRKPSLHGVRREPPVCPHVSRVCHSRMLLTAPPAAPCSAAAPPRPCPTRMAAPPHSCRAQSKQIMLKQYGKSPHGFAMQCVAACCRGGVKCAAQHAIWELKAL
jgi:hypothetical protein